METASIFSIGYTGTPAQRELAVTLGSRPQHHLPCCLIAVWVPPEIAAEQRRKAKRKAQKHQKILTQTYLDFLSWNLFVTNVPPHTLSAAQVGLL